MLTNRLYIFFIYCFICTANICSAKCKRQDTILLDTLCMRIIVRVWHSAVSVYAVGPKSVTQPDASPKRYLWDKISC